MKITAVTVYVKPESTGDFIEASLIHQANTVKEPGNLRFDFLQSVDDPSQFLFYEVYESEEDIHLHRKAQSYRNWRRAVDHLMAVPRQGVAYKALAPDKAGQFHYP